MVNDNGQQGILKTIADTIRNTFSNLQSNVSLTRSTLMSQRSGNVQGILSGFQAKGNGVLGFGFLPVLKPSAPAEGTPAGNGAAPNGVTPPPPPPLTQTQAGQQTVAGIQII